MKTIKDLKNYVKYHTRIVVKDLVDIEWASGTELMLINDMKVKKNNVSRWGIYSLSKKLNKNNFFIKDVIEKPTIKNAPSTNAVIGRYILPKKIFSKLKNLKPGKGGEIHITDAIKKLINEGDKFIGHKFRGKYLDCGSMSGYIKSGIEISKL